MERRMGLRLRAYTRYVNLRQRDRRILEASRPRDIRSQS